MPRYTVQAQGIYEGIKRLAEFLVKETWREGMNQYRIITTEDTTNLSYFMVGTTSLDSSVVVFPDRDAREASVAEARAAFQSSLDAADDYQLEDGTAYLVNRADYAEFVNINGVSANPESTQGGMVPFQSGYVENLFGSSGISGELPREVVRRAEARIARGDFA